MRTQRSGSNERRSDSGTLGLLGHSKSDFHGEIANICQRGKKWRGWVCEGGRMFGESASCGDQHRIRDSLRADSSRRGTQGDDRKPDGRKNVDVIALRNRNAPASEMDWWKRRASGDECAAAGPAI